MSIIIRLQNLPLSAKAADIREFFGDLKIPKGAVNIVGGPEGDAFIGFATDEDARLAMRFDGNTIHQSKIRLLLSSRREMESVISNAHAMAAAVFSGNKPVLPVSQVDLTLQNRTKPVESTSSEWMHHKNVKGDFAQFVSGSIGGEGGANQHHQPLQCGHQQHQPATSSSSHHSYQQHFESDPAPLSQPSFPTTQSSFQPPQSQRLNYQPAQQQPLTTAPPQQPFGFLASGGNGSSQNTQPYSLQQPSHTQQVFTGSHHDYRHTSQTSGGQAKAQFFDGNNQQLAVSAFESLQNKAQQMAFGNNRPIFEQPPSKTQQQQTNVQPSALHFAAVTQSSQPATSAFESSYKASSTQPQSFAANRHSGVASLRQPLLSLDPQLNSGTGIITTTSSSTGFHVTNVPNQSIFTFVQSKAAGVDNVESVSAISSKNVEAVDFEHQKNPVLASPFVAPATVQQSDEFCHVELSHLPSELLRPANLEAFLAPTVPLTLSSVKFVQERSGGAQLVLVRFGCRGDAQRLLLRNGERGIRVKMLAKEDFERAEDGKFLPSLSPVDDRSGGKAMKRTSRVADADEGGRKSSGVRSRSSRKKRRDDRSSTRRTRSRSKTPTDRHGSIGGAATLPPSMARSRSRSPLRKERETTTVKKDALSADNHRVCVQIFNVPYRTTSRDMDKFLSSLGALHYTKATKIMPAGKMESDRWVIEFVSDRDARPLLRANRAQLQLFQRYLRSEAISPRAADTIYDSMERQSRLRDSVSPSPPTRRTERKKKSPSEESPPLSSKQASTVGDAKLSVDTWRKGMDVTSVVTSALNGHSDVAAAHFTSNAIASSSALLPFPQPAVLTSQAQLPPSMRPFSDKINVVGRNGGGTGGSYGHHKNSGTSLRCTPFDDAVGLPVASSPPPKMVLEASTEEELIRRGELPPTSFGAFSSTVVTNERYGASGRLGGIDGFPRPIRHQLQRPMMMHGAFGLGRGLPPAAHRTLLPSGPRFASRGGHFHLNAFRPPPHFGTGEALPSSSNDDTTADNGWRRSNSEEASAEVIAPIGDGKPPPSLLSLRFGGPPAGLRASWPTTTATVPTGPPPATRSGDDSSVLINDKKSMDEGEKPVAEEKSVKEVDDTKNTITVMDTKCVDIVDIEESGADERKLSVVDDLLPQHSTAATAADVITFNTTETSKLEQMNADDCEDNDAIVAAAGDADGFFTRHRGPYAEESRQRRPILGFVAMVCGELVAERRQRTVIRMCGVPPMVHAERLCQFLGVPLSRPSENIYRVPNGDLYVNLADVGLATRATATRNGKPLDASPSVTITQLSRAQMCRTVMELQDTAENADAEKLKGMVDGNLKDKSHGKGCTNDLGMEAEDYSTGEEEEEIIVISSNNKANSANSSSSDDANSSTNLLLA